jgi:hypothetical protein
MATDQHVRAGGIPVLDRYFEALRRQDWESLAACLAEDVHRTGPYRDEVRGREAYVAFLSKVIPSLRDYDLVVSQAHAIGSDAAVVELSELVTVDGSRREHPELLLFGFDAAGKIRRVDVYLKTAPPAAARTGERPPVWVGHVTLHTHVLDASEAFMIALGLRPIGKSDEVAVLELRGGTHLVLLRTDAPGSGAAPFDLMAEDLDATHRRLTGLGLAPSPIVAGRIHRSFTVRDPSGQDVTFHSNHVSDLPV